VKRAWNVLGTWWSQVTCVLATVLVTFVTPKGEDVLVKTHIVALVYPETCVILSYISGICEARDSQHSLL